MTPAPRTGLVLALAGGLLLAPTVVPVDSPLGAVSATAAADELGLPRNVIRRVRSWSRNGSARVVTTTQARNGAPVGDATVTTAFVPLDGGPDLPPSTQSAPQTRTARWDATVSAPFVDAGAATVDVFVQQADGSTASATLPITGNQRSGWALAEGGSAALRVAARWLDGDEADGSRLRVFVRGTAAGWDSSTVAAVDAVLTDAEGMVLPTEPASEARVNERWVTTVTGDAAATGFAYAVTTTFADGSGAVLDQQTETRVFAPRGAGQQAGPIGVRAATRGNGTAGVVAWTLDDAGDADSVQVSLTDAISGEVVLDRTLTQPTKTVRSLYVGNVEFDVGESPVGSTYLVLLDLLDAAGSPIGAQREFEATVLGADDTAALAVVDGDDGLGPVGVALFEEEDGTFGAFVEVHGDALPVAGASLVFEEPFDGPAPLETEINPALTWTLRTWKTTSSAAAPALGVLGVTDGHGSLSGTVELPETLGRAAGNGKGTRKSINIALQPVLPLL